MKRFVVGSVLAVMLFAASVRSAWAQEETPFIQFGARAAVVMHSTYEIDEVVNHHYGPGFGFGVGLVLRHTVSDALNFRGEPSFYWRGLYTYTSGLMPISVDEMALCIPLMANYFISPERIYISGGLELDLPFKTQRFEYSSGVDIGYDRSFVDIGFLIGGGYMIAENIGVDARYVIYFNNPRKSSSELLMSYGIGAFILF